jgi:hypothetical protein
MKIRPWCQDAQNTVLVMIEFSVAKLDDQSSIAQNLLGD